MELLQGRAPSSPTLTKEEAGQAAVQAMEQSQKNTAQRYLRLFQIFLWAGAALCGISLVPSLSLGAHLLYFDLFRAPELGVIGSADSTTFIVTTGSPLIPHWLQPVLTAAVLLLCVILALRVRQLERRLK